MNEIQFVDTTLRDGQASLWAENMRTGMMLAIAERLDNAGYHAIEVIASSHIKKCVRELRENPFERMRLVAQKIKKTTLRAIGAERIGAFEISPDSVVDLWFERLLANGMRQLRISDPANDPDGWRKSVARARRVGLGTVVNLIYSVSPKHTDEYYARKAREAAASKPWRICFKDVGGLLTPERARRLIPMILKSAGDIPVEFHGHCNSGQAPLCYLEGVKLGMRILHTAVPPLANRSSQPSIFNIAANLKALGFSPAVDLKPLEPVVKHFTAVAKRDGLPIGKPVEYDHSQYLHQVPGGMISNMRHQLKIVGMEDKMEAALEEAEHVRKDFGYPIMVTPLSQYVGTQAAINVILGERYKEVPDQVIQYALGIWGKEAVEVTDPDVRDKILGRSRAKEWTRWEQPEPT